MIYRGIDLEKHHDLWNWASTYHLLDSDRINQYLDDDRLFQKKFKRFLYIQKIKRNTLIILFNLSIYAIFYGIVILIQG